MHTTNTEPGSAHRRLTILVVEDNSINQQVARKIIEFLGHRADLVDNGEAAVLAVRDTAYDLVLMDCQMPIMDGYEATRAIRRLPEPAGTVPIIAMTAHSFPGDTDQCRNAGMTDFLPKPILPDSLARVIARAIS